MQVISVNLGRIRETSWKGKVFKTDIFKEPVSGPVHVATLGLEGDQQAKCDKPRRDPQGAVRLPLRTLHRILAACARRHSIGIR
jgi:MOSC domain-containing protein YiiM